MSDPAAPVAFEMVRRQPAQRTADWAGIAADSGFSDQAHLIREFTALADSRLTRPQAAISEG